ncbi:MAG: ATP-binding protein [Candidatus Kariarchaeaceae archaeon]
MIFRICKEQQELLGNECSYPKRVCITYSAFENAYRDSPTVQVVTRDEALMKLKEARDAGLVHTTMNIQSEAGYICNCCTCCCGVLRGLTEWEQPNAFAKSNYVLSIDEELCTGCGICIDRCQFSALELEDEVLKVDNRCVGCGVCVIACPEEVLSLVTRTPADQSEPPGTMIDWMNQRSQSRGVDPSDLLK